MDLEELRAFLDVVETGSFLAAADTLDDVDMAVHFGDDAPKGPWSSRVVRRFREGLLASKEYLKGRAVPRSLDDLHDHELLSWEAPGGDARVWPTLQGSTFMVEPVAITSDRHLIRRGSSRSSSAS